MEVSFFLSHGFVSFPGCFLIINGLKGHEILSQWKTYWGGWIKFKKKEDLLFIPGNFWSYMTKTCAKIPKRSEILDPQDPGSSRILDLIFSSSHRILEILDPVTATLPWDHRDLGSQTDKILPDLGDPGSSLSKLPWDLADLGSYTTIMSLDFDHPLHPMKFCFWLPIAMRCLNLSSARNFNHTLIQPLCVELKTGSPFGPFTCFLL